MPESNIFAISPRKYRMIDSKLKNVRMPNWVTAKEIKIKHRFS